MSERTLFPIVTICGSMRYYGRMLTVASELTSRGFVVLMPFSVAEESSMDKAVLDTMHFTKIDMSDMIVIVGKHRGESTMREIEYARHLGLKIWEKV
jgi:predicted Rossmann-fold nucleotide-binding protein